MNTELFQQYKNEMSAVKDKYENEVSAIKDKYKPLLLAAIPDTWDVIKNHDGRCDYCIYNASLKELNRKHSMSILNKEDIQIKNIATLKKLLNTADNAYGLYYIVGNTQIGSYDIRIKGCNNVFKIQYDAYSHSFEDTISKKNLCDILEKLIEIGA